MQVIDNVQELINLSRSWDSKKKVGFVPTMGALHQGHFSLVKKARECCDIVVTSIFVNPTQFGPNEDLDSYPKTFENDYNNLKSLGVDYVYYPSVEQMYPKGYKTYVNVEDITKTLCGASRPGHFRGVCTVVLKLVNLVNPTLMFMGEKDFQQIVVLETMLRDLNFDTKIVRCPIVRDFDGLALSSRNKYLSTKEREIAPKFHLAMLNLQKEVLDGNNNRDILYSNINKNLSKEGFTVDYVKIVDDTTLEEVSQVVKGNRLMCAIYLGKTRLIDNLEI